MVMAIAVVLGEDGLGTGRCIDIAAHVAPVATSILQGSGLWMRCREKESY